MEGRLEGGCLQCCAGLPERRGGSRRSGRVPLDAEVGPHNNCKRTASRGVRCGAWLEASRFAGRSCGAEPG